jgi:hypothetical protein
LERRSAITRADATSGRRPRPPASAAVPRLHRPPRAWDSWPVVKENPASTAEELRVSVQLGDDADPEELAATTSKLRRQLLQLDVEDVSLPAAAAPEGARAADAVEVGVLVVALVRSPGVVASIGQVLSTWISARSQRSAVVHVEDRRIELTGVTRDDQARMLALFERPGGGE